MRKGTKPKTKTKPTPVSVPDVQVDFQPLPPRLIDKLMTGNWGISVVATDAAGNLTKPARRRGEIINRPTHEEA